MLIEAGGPFVRELLDRHRDRVAEAEVDEDLVEMLLGQLRDLEPLQRNRYCKPHTSQAG